jgi:hypothetical protein
LIAPLSGDHDARRRVLCVERRIRIDRPPTAPPPAPDGAEQVLEQLGRVFAPGAQVGVAEIAAACGIKGEAARAVRAWALAAGLWPYRDAPGGFQARGAGRREGGTP